MNCPPYQTMEKKIHSETGSDRISDLPEPIRRHILSFLTTREAVQASILSSSWRGLWTGLPCLDLSLYHLGNLLTEDRLPLIDEGNAAKSRREAIIRKREEFYDFLDRALGSVKELEKLDVYVPGFGPELESRLDNWLECAIGCNVKELTLNIATRGVPKYSLPRSVFGANSLLKLELHHLQLNLTKLKDVNVPSLQVLYLVDVHFDEGVMESILAHCPSLEDITFRYCQGLSRLEVPGLTKLKKVDVEDLSNELNKIEINAPNLLEFVFVNGGDVEEDSCLIEVSACKNMKRLVLSGAPLYDEDLFDLLESLPLLEHLSLSNCEMLERVEISSQTLLHLAFQDCSELSVVRIINTPNLKSFDYGGDDPITLVSKGSALKLAEANVTLKPSIRNDNWYARLIKLLAKLSRAEHLTLEVGFTKDLILPEEVMTKSRPPLVGIKHLMVDLRNSSPNRDPVKLLETLLWLAPRPESISINNFSTGVGKKVTFTYERPVKGKKKCGCWKSIAINCWRHSLIKVVIENENGTGNDEKLADFFHNARTDVKIECVFKNGEGPEWLQGVESEDDDEDGFICSGLESH